MKYILDLQSMGQEEWIGFRNKAYTKVMNFILKWQEKLKDTQTTPLTVKIHNELEILKVINNSKHYNVFKCYPFFIFV